MSQNYTLFKYVLPKALLNDQLNKFISKQCHNMVSIRATRKCNVWQIRNMYVEKTVLLYCRIAYSYNMWLAFSTILYNSSSTNI